MYTEDDTKDYYDSLSDVYEEIWNEEIHTGLFDRDDKTLGEAVKDMDRFLAKEAGIEKGMRVLNAGCGRGGADRILASEFGALVTGLDLSPRQLSRAKERAGKARLDIAYLQGTMTRMPVETGAFDRVWIQEAFFHVHDKDGAAAEVARTLRQGGKLVIEDTVLANAVDRPDVLAHFGGRVLVNEMLTADEHIKIFERNGLVLEKQIDISVHLSRTYAMIVQFIRSNAKTLEERIPEEYRPRIAAAFGFPISQSLVDAGKLGCVVMVFRKK